MTRPKLTKYIKNGSEKLKYTKENILNRFEHSHLLTSLKRKKGKQLGMKYNKNSNQINKIQQKS